MNYATKTGIDAAKTASKRIVQNTAETTGDLIGNKIAYKITSPGKTKSKEKKDETNKRQETYIPPKKRQEVIDDSRLFRYSTKSEYQKIANLLNTTFDNISRFNTKIWVEVHGQSGGIYSISNQIRFKKIHTNIRYI